MAHSLPVAAYVATELSLSRTPRRKAKRRVTVYREGMRTALTRKAGFCCKVVAIVFVAVCGTFAVHLHNSYSSFARLIDQQIAGGYLRSHAGLYSSPRIIEKGALISKDQLATSLQRAGYARDKASNIWNGSFQMSENSIRILTPPGKRDAPVGRRQVRS
jgi:hypothetical protein